MATKIVTKNSSTASAVPTASDLVQGELAVNVADKRLFTEDNGGAIVELGTNPSTLTVAGEITANGGIALGDNDKATFGAGDDLQIYHDGSNSYIQDQGLSGTGNLILAGADVEITTFGGNKYFQGASNIARLYHTNNEKLATTSTGIDVTGTATMDGLTVDKSSQATIVATSDSTVDVRLVADTSLTEGSIRTSGTTPNLGFYVGGTKYANISDGGDISFYEDTGTTPKLFWDASAESLGIGTSSPAGITAGVTTLSISDTGSKTTGDKIGQLSFITDDSSFIPTYSDGVGAEISAVSTSAVGGAYGLSFVTSTTTGSNRAERMRIDSSGNLLVGKSASSFNAAGAEIRTSGVVIGTVDGAAGLIANRLTSDGTLIQLSKDGTTVGSIGTNAATMYVSAPQAGGMKYSYLTSTNAVMLPVTTSGANADGLHDLGMSNARFKDLHLSGEVIAGAGANNNPSITSHVDTDTGLFFGGGNILGFSTGGAERMRISSGGDVSIGLSGVGTPTRGVVINGGLSNSLIRIGHDNGTPSGDLFMQFAYNGSQIGKITQNGTSQVLYQISSDQRLKENITDADDSSAIIDAIRVRKFDWRVDGKHQRYGMIAQELQTVAPEAVGDVSDSEEMMGVDYSKLVPMMLKEIQSLRNRVAQLEG